MQDKYLFGSIGIISIAGLTGVALMCGHDGITLSLAIGAIGTIVGGIAGFAFGKGQNIE